MSNKHQRWLPEEDSILITKVKANPQNLNFAFIQANEILDRSVGACANRWYTVLSKKYKENPDNVCFAIFSRERQGINRKNCRVPSTVQKNKNVWKAIINFVKGLV